MVNKRLNLSKYIFLLLLKISMQMLINHLAIIW